MIEHQTLKPLSGLAEAYEAPSSLIVQLNHRSRLCINGSLEETEEIEGDWE